jgi:hypothetical protein
LTSEILGVCQAIKAGCKKWRKKNGQERREKKEKNIKENIKCTVLLEMHLYKPAVY